MVFLTILSIGKLKFECNIFYYLFLVVFGMVSTNMYTLTQALKGVFVDPPLTDESNNRTGPSFQKLHRIEDFWQVKKPADKD
jgi:hypothetical protein